jgi:crotonobetainyl-CoA:carnitine CoA-transferase CaiB-like acyl-CoA transferase
VSRRIAVDIGGTFTDLVVWNQADGTLRRAKVLTTLNNAGAAAAPVYDVADVFADPHFQARENIAAVPDGDLGVVRMHNVAPKLSRTPGGIDWAGPRLGAQAAEVLHDRLGVVD